MSFSGTLEDLSFSEVLQLLHLEEKTGTLIIWTPWEGKTLIFKNGNILFAGMMDKGEKLGDILVSSKVISELQLRESLRIQREGRGTKRLGDILKSKYGLTETDIQQGLLSYMSESVFSVFSWDEGEFRFSNEMIKKEENIPFPLNISIENIIMEGSRRIDETEKILEEIPHKHFILKLNIDIAGIDNVNLHPDEWKVLSLVDDQKDIEDLRLFTGMTDFDLLKIIFSLKNAHIIVLEEKETKK